MKMSWEGKFIPSMEQIVFFGKSLQRAHRIFLSQVLKFLP